MFKQKGGLAFSIAGSERSAIRDSDRIRAGIFPRPIKEFLLFRFAGAPHDIFGGVVAEMEPAIGALNEFKGYIATVPVSDNVIIGRAEYIPSPE